jgi:polyhydroxybutyrate depolymerase
MTGPLVSLFLLALAPVEGKLLTFDVDGGPREAIVYLPSQKEKETAPPLVFVFHGHGGRARRAAARINLHKDWPGAVVVYMQGISGVPGVNDPMGKLPGWQKAPGDQRDRDVKFFDVALERIERDQRTDADRVYVLGHSNGARFASVLWQTRGDKLAALCCAAAQGGRLIRNCQPKPVFLIMGEKDNVVPFEWQKRSIALARQTLRVDPLSAKVDGSMRTEAGIDRSELVTYIHTGGHEYPADATPHVVKFFQRHKRHVEAD